MSERWADGPAGRLNALLRQARISSVKAASRIGQTHSNVSKYRRGEVTPPADQLAALLELVPGASADYVLGLNSDEIREKAAAVIAAAEGLVAVVGRPHTGQRARGRGGPRQP